MKVLKKIDKNYGIALALGYFDGIHLGHKKLLDTLIKEARDKNLKTAVITFSTNPADYFCDTPTLAIQTFKDREILLSDMGIDYLYELNFEEYKDISGADYIDLLYKYFEPKIIIAGYNHTFGKDKSGSAWLLKENASKYGYQCIIIPEQRYEEQIISSSEIRKNIQYGDLKKVKSLLGRSFSVRNSVIRGDMTARKLGYPTANLIYSDTLAKLPYGVYFGYTRVDNNILPSLISWGTKPTLTDGENEILETHIYNFNKEIYGKIIKVMFIKKLRDEMKFSDINALKAQIRNDYGDFTRWVNTLK